VRPGRPEDLPAIRELLRADVLAGRRDCLPGARWLRRHISDFDWAARSRIVERGGAPLASLLVLSRRLREGTVARLEIGGEREAAQPLLEWGVGLSRAAGARAAQIWGPLGDDRGLRGLGAVLVRPFWRMDRPDLEAVPERPLPTSYRLVDRRTGPDPAEWSEAYNAAFADHWNHSPKDPLATPDPAQPPELGLMALAPDGRPAATVICRLESFESDRRAQPVGLVGSVGTVPEHRRRGLASALTAEGLRRLRDLRARSASLYVDGLNPTRAYDLYRALGFEIGFAYDVYEAPGP